MFCSTKDQRQCKVRLTGSKIPNKKFVQKPENDILYNFVILCGNPEMTKKLIYPNASYDLTNGIPHPEPFYDMYINLSKPAWLCLLVGRPTRAFYLKTLFTFEIKPTHFGDKRFGQLWSPDQRAAKAEGGRPEVSGRIQHLCSLCVFA
ncbi:hypothetical protein JMG10_06835 [Nostoc ellipsosporum NOK]|nr:hypothetical protein [Nostoc ellipsosporum NOK]